MVEKINQLVIEKVENGFIISGQRKGEEGGLFGSPQIDKDHYVATNENGLYVVLKNLTPDLVSRKELEKLISEEKGEDELDKSSTEEEDQK